MTTKMNEFKIFAQGVSFDAKAYLAATPLNMDGIWLKGQTSRNHPKSNGVFKVLGDGQKVHLFEQERIAIEYISANKTPLKALGKYPGVTTFIL